jgi:UrcA family protein
MATPNKLKAALIGITMFAATAPVFAGPALEAIPTSREVRYGDLDLSTERGQQRFETRIKAAVRLVCGDVSNQAPAEMEHIKACKVQALSKARRDAATVIAQYENDTRVAVGRTNMVGN